MKTPISRRIGRNIAQLRGGCGWSQEKLAARAEVDASTVQRWECGERVPCGVDIYKLSLALGVSADEIFAGLPKSVAEVEEMHRRKCGEHPVLS